MGLISWDIEISKVIPEGDSDWKRHRPLGVSCAAAAYRLDSGSPICAQWSGYPGASKETKQRMVHWLGDMVKEGHKIVTWNGLGFDFDIVAEETGLYNLCKTIALGHVDMMFMVVAAAGHYLSLDKAATGMGLKGKVHDVRLNDGSLLTGMDGAKAPELWHRKEFDAVLAYLNGDVIQTLELAEAVEENKFIRWRSGAGKTNKIHFAEGLMTVDQCLQMGLPNTSWMATPPTREQFLEWMDKEN